MSRLGRPRLSYIPQGSISVFCRRVWGLIVYQRILGRDAWGLNCGLIEKLVSAIDPWKDLRSTECLLGPFLCRHPAHLYVLLLVCLLGVGPVSANKLLGSQPATAT
ncbi:uncharacterized protein YALI1_C09195g [Yarrowia lipolytica]|uniref:Uncharacterized protein n=1 Tax=Yarrowia lipolytica TaxID=4952 RepID=A0A1D8N9Y9_YARLL|nr:hypothetical protein YALI1_C09195g [Yarrowia lipolytica]